MKKNSRYKKISIVCLSIVPFFLEAQLVIQVVGIPPSTPNGAEIYIAGTMNEWNPGNTKYLLQLDSKNNYVIELPIQKGLIEFKFTRGSWEMEEIHADKSKRANRRVEYRGGRQIESDTIQAWLDLDGKIPDKHELDGAWVLYKYETSGEVRMSFSDGKVKWKWLDDSNTKEAERDQKAIDEDKGDLMPYRSQKIGNHVYVVNWYHKPTGSYVTIIFNFDEKQVCGSAILGAKEEGTSTIFDRGVIKDFKLK